VEWKIEARNRKGVIDPLGKGIEKDIKDLGIAGVKKITHAQVFVVSGDTSNVKSEKELR